MVLVYFCSQRSGDGDGQVRGHVAAVENLAQHFWVFQTPFCCQSPVLIMMFPDCTTVSYWNYQDGDLQEMLMDWGIVLEMMEVEMEKEFLLMVTRVCVPQISDGLENECF
jgi:hypothetical protein